MFYITFFLQAAIQLLNNISNEEMNSHDHNLQSRKRPRTMSGSENDDEMRSLTPLLSSSPSQPLTSTLSSISFESSSLSPTIPSTSEEEDNNMIHSCDSTHNSDCVPFLSSTYALPTSVSSTNAGCKERGNVISVTSSSPHSPAPFSRHTHTGHRSGLVSSRVSSVRHRRGRSSTSTSSRSSTSSKMSSSPRPSQRHAPPQGKRRVYSSTTEGGIIQTECDFEGTTCIYDTNLPKTRQMLLNLPNVFGRYVLCLLEQTTYSPFKHICELVENVVDKQIQVCASQQVEHGEFKRVQSLFRLQRYVSNTVNYRIGRLVNELSEKNHTARNLVVCNICNEAGEAKEKKYMSVLLRCSKAGCSQCRTAQLFDSLGRHGTTPLTPCTATQACCRLLEMDYQNFTPTFFRQCIDVAGLPFYSPIIRSSEAPSCVRTALAPAATSLYKSLTTYRLPSLTSGCVPVFPLHADESAIEAIQYTDGDGGYIVMEHFDLLKEYVDTLSSKPSIMFLTEHGYHMLPFRELFHDAIELAHEYEVTSELQQTPQKHKWGYEALVCARRNIAQSVRLWLVPTSLDTSGNRLLTEIFTLEAEELMPCSTGVRLIEAGLSHLTDNSPILYKEAWSRAKQQQTGVHKYSLGEQPEVHPVYLKQALTRRAPVPSTVTVQVVSLDTTITCTVKNNPHADYLNEANVWILKSTLHNAGLGLFLKPTLPSKHCICIPAKKVICTYSAEPITTPLLHMATTDYLIEAEHRGSILSFNPQVYDGQNIGRFINQGGLLEGIQEMCLCCDKQQGGSGIQQGRIHKVMEDKCNTAYQISSGSVLHVVSLQRLESAPTPTELLANYSYTYWTRYIASHYKDLGLKNPVVRGFLWCYLSRNSVLYRSADFDTSCIPQSVLSQFYDMECPFRQGQRRKSYNEG